METKPPIEKPKPYEKPILERLGKLRKLTLSGGCLAMADGTNPYHRYDPSNQSCPMD